MSRLPLLPPITQRRLLLGEGRDEEVIFARLLEAHQIDGFQVIAYHGRDNLRNFLAALTVFFQFFSSHDHHCHTRRRRECGSRPGSRGKRHHGGSVPGTDSC